MKMTPKENMSPNMAPTMTPIMTPKEYHSKRKCEAAPRPRGIYQKAATYLTSVIVCCFIFGPVVYLCYIMFKPNSEERFVCGIAAVVLGLISIICLVAAVEQYMRAKDEEWDEILEALDRIRRGIEGDCEEE